MGTGYLLVQVRTAGGLLPVMGATVRIYSASSGNTHYTVTTDESGDTPTYAFSAPDKSLTLDPDYNAPAYSIVSVDVTAPGYITQHISGIQIIDTETAILPVNLEPQPLGEPAVDEYIDIPPLGVITPGERDQNEAPPPAPGDYDPPGAPLSVTGRVFIPDYITVHLGTPSNTSARNVRVRFIDYIKNVTSHEIYATWPENSLRANINVIVTFALNRVFTEWYRSRGYNYDITNSTTVDMIFVEGGQIYANISRLVDELFSTYAHRQGYINPFFTQFCNGTTAKCNGLSQWGTVTLAQSGLTPLQILHSYYPNDLVLTNSSNIAGITESFPGTALRAGSRGEDVRRIQTFLNRIRQNFPAIPRIDPIDGIFGTQTTAAVTAFQKIFNLAADGVVGRSTWNKLTQIFVGVTRLGELDSEGIREDIGTTPPNITLSQGARGDDVRRLQEMLAFIAEFYDGLFPPAIDSIFGPTTRVAVQEFQRTFGLGVDGVVGPVTWRKLYDVYFGIRNNAPIPPAVTPPGPPTPPPPAIPPFPGTVLRLGSSGPSVQLMQTYLNSISQFNNAISSVAADGIFGPRTQNAVIQFQRYYGLTPDGIIGPLTWNRIAQVYSEGGTSPVTPPPPAPPSTTYPGTALRAGSSGAAVRLMQQYLNDLAARYPSIPVLVVDGVYGANTQAAVMAFQRLFGLTPDGVIGLMTWNAITARRNAL